MICPKPPKKKGRHKQTIACDISPKVRAKVEERDGGKCVICGCNKGIPNCHYIARSHGGLGVEQNIVSACLQCHHEMDNGPNPDKYKLIVRNYLMSKYEGWNENDLKYDKHKI